MLTTRMRPRYSPSSVAAADVGRPGKGVEATVDDRLDMRIKTSATDVAQRIAPWRPDIPWWAVGIQGIVALVLGLWLLINQGAGDPVVAALGVALLLVAGAWAWSAMRSDLPQVVLGWRGLRAGVGITVGALLVLDFLLDYLAGSAPLVVLAVGLLIVGGIGAAEWFAGRDRMGWRWPSLVGSAAALGFGFVVLASRLQAAPIFLQVLAIALIVLGVLLLARAGLLFRQNQVMRQGPGTTGGSSTPTPVPQASAGAAAPTATVRSAASTKPVDGAAPGLGTGADGGSAGPAEHGSAAHPLIEATKSVNNGRPPADT